MLPGAGQKVPCGGGWVGGWVVGGWLVGGRVGGKQFSVFSLGLGFDQ
jgi:hypothetical protein